MMCWRVLQALEICLNSPFILNKDLLYITRTLFPAKQVCRAAFSCYWRAAHVLVCAAARVHTCCGLGCSLAPGVATAVWRGVRAHCARMCVQGFKLV